MNTKGTQFTIQMVCMLAFKTFSFIGVLGIGWVIEIWGPCLLGSHAGLALNIQNIVWSLPSRKGTKIK